MDEYDAFDDLESCTDVPASLLPDGWVWRMYSDGSGHLESPDHKTAFGYDRAPYAGSGWVEYQDCFLHKPFDWDIHYGSIDSFMAYAEQLVADRLAEYEVAQQSAKVCAEFQADPEKYAEYLQFRSQFYQYSNRNALLIYLQNPHAQFVGSKAAFASHGIHILPGQEGQGMEIYRPNQIELFIRDGAPVSVANATPEEQAAIAAGEIRTWTRTNFRLEMVYDIAQTDCPISQYPALLNLGKSSEQAADLFQQLKRLSMDTGVPVLEKNLRSATLGGYYNRAENTITINTLGNDTKKLTVMAHEYAHAMLHRTSSASTVVKEFEAESLAVLLQSRLGVPPAEGDTRYVKKCLEQCRQEPQFSLEKSMERIHRQLQFITEKLDLRSQLEYSLAPQHEAKPEKAPQEPMSQAVLHESDAPTLEELYTDFVQAP